MLCLIDCTQSVCSHTHQNLVVFEAPVDLSTHDSNQFKYLVFQCGSDADAKKMTKACRQAFELMLTKTTLENLK